MVDRRRKASTPESDEDVDGVDEDVMVIIGVEPQGIEASGR